MAGIGRNTQGLHRGVASNEIDLTSRTGSGLVMRWISVALTLLFAAGCLASFVAGPEEMAVRLMAGAGGLVVVLVVALAVAVRRRAPTRLVVDHEGIRVLPRRGRALVRLAWTELSGVGVMTNEVALRRKRRGARLRAAAAADAAAVPIWLELYPANPDAVARHPELHGAWSLGSRTAPGEKQRWLVHIGDTLGQEFPIDEAVQRWRPQLWRGNRSGSVFFGGNEARNNAELARMRYARSRQHARGPARPADQAAGH
jgi:hypothetical protein